MTNTDHSDTYMLMRDCTEICDRKLGHEATNKQNGHALATIKNITPNGINTEDVHVRRANTDDTESKNVRKRANGDTSPQFHNDNVDDEITKGVSHAHLDIAHDFNENIDAAEEFPHRLCS